MPTGFRTALCGALVALFAAASPAPAENAFARGISDDTKYAIIAGVAATFASSRTEGPERAARMADATIIAASVAEYLKPVLVVNSGGRFPSSHSAAAFAAAACLADTDPPRKWLYYLGAALVGWSRVELGAHQWEDVVAGAALGIAVGNWSLTSKDGLLLERVFKF